MPRAYVAWDRAAGAIKISVGAYAAIVLVRVPDPTAYLYRHESGLAQLQRDARSNLERMVDRAAARHTLEIGAMLRHDRRREMNDDVIPRHATRVRPPYRSHLDRKIIDWKAIAFAIFVDVERHAARQRSTKKLERSRGFIRPPSRRRLIREQPVTPHGD